MLNFLSIKPLLKCYANIRKPITMKYPTYMLEGGTYLKLGTQNEPSKH